MTLISSYKDNKDIWEKLSTLDCQELKHLIVLSVHKEIPIQESLERILSLPIEEYQKELRSENNMSFAIIKHTLEAFKELHPEIGEETYE